MSRSRPVVSVSRWLFPEVMQALRAHVELRDNPDDVLWDAATLRSQLATVDAAIVTTTERVDASVLPAQPATGGRLRLISTVSVGFNHIDVAACNARGIQVAHTPDVLTEATADFGMALLLAAARRVTEGERLLRAGGWQRWSLDFLNGQTVFGATLGIYGMGRIGQALARRAARGFDMRVLYHNRSRLPEELERDCGDARLVSKADLFALSDFVVVLAPYSAQTRHAVGAAELALMQRHAVLVNLARGGIVDELALALALREERLASAALDVFEDEPQVRPELLALDNVVLTPHIASSTRATRLAMAQLAADNVLATFGLYEPSRGVCQPLAAVPGQTLCHNRAAP